MGMAIFEGWSSMTGLGRVKGRIAVPEGLKMGLLHDPEEEEVRAGTTFQSTDFDLEWHLSSADDETPRPVWTRYAPPAARDGSGSIQYTSSSWSHG
jgi:hypothetical protein